MYLHVRCNLSTVAEDPSGATDGTTQWNKELVA